MASATIIGKKNTADRNTIGTITLDVTVSESHQADVDVTDHPVEVGFNITDHVRPKPEELTLEGIISNTPFDKFDPPRVRTVEGETIEYASELDQTLADKAYQELARIKNAGEIITVVTWLKKYENMVITSLMIPRDKNTGEALRFTAKLKQIRTVSLQTVTIAVPKGQKKIDKGTKPPKPVVDPRTILQKISAGAGNMASAAATAVGL